MSSYATPAQLAQFGINPAALTSFSTPQIQAALDVRSNFADSKFRSRYRLPLLPPFDPAISQAVCQMAAFDLIRVRGFNPANPADMALKMGSDQGEAWFMSVARQEAHPDVNETAPVDFQFPTVSTNPKQGW